MRRGTSTQKEVLENFLPTLHGNNVCSPPAMPGVRDGIASQVQNVPSGYLTANIQKLIRL